MFLGEYRHSLDYKGRLAVPKKFRKDLGSEAILTRGLDGCLFLYSKQPWEKLTTKMEQLPLTQADARSFARYLFGSASQVNFDRLGRVAIPGYLKEYANLDKSAIFVGVLERIEIWDEKRWKAVEKKFASSAEIAAERLKEAGI